jgi:hypothetical protein
MSMPHTGSFTAVVFFILISLLFCLPEYLSRSVDRTSNGLEGTQAAKTAGRMTSWVMATRSATQSRSAGSYK